MPFAQVNNINLYYERHGQGKPVVFLHGYTGSCDDWKNQVDALPPGYRALVLDHRGHGRTEAPKREDDYAIKLFEEDVFSLLKYLHIECCCLAGHSMGGYIALEFVLDHPELVEALILVDTSSGDLERPPGYEQLRKTLENVAVTQGMEAAFEYEAAHNPMRMERFERHPELKEISRRNMLNTSVEGYIYAARSFGKWPGVTERLAEIHVPTMIFVGEEDEAFLKSARTLGEHIPSSELVTVAAVGHSPHKEAPDRFNKALSDFLSQLQ